VDVLIHSSATIFQALTNTIVLSTTFPNSYRATFTTAELGLIVPAVPNLLPNNLSHDSLGLLLQRQDVGTHFLQVAHRLGLAKVAGEADLIADLMLSSLY